MNDKIIQFPCDFLIKIIGKNTSSFESDILNIAQQFYPEITEQAMTSQMSKTGIYRSLSLSVYAKDQATLDGLYHALTKHPHVNMVL